jgi:ABC-2 type transport system ATP-binding protein
LTNAIEVVHLSHAYGARVALSDVTFEVRRGEMFGLLGPNGGGKTTLFRILSTLIRPTSGTARILGADDPRRHIGVVFQAASLDRKLSVRENLVHQGHLYGLRGRDLGARIDELLGRVGMADRADDRCEKLSGGQRRRVEVAKGLLHRPEVLLLDEAGTGLDPGARRDLRELLRGLNTTILMTTHLMDEAEACDRLAILDGGRLVALDSPAALKSAVGGDVVSVAPEELCDEIRAKFGGEPRVLDGTVRVERERGHELAARIVDAFPGRVQSITVAKPTLEDVFIHHTGRRLE